MPDLAVHFLPAWVPNTGRVSLVWGEPCPTITSARYRVRAEVDGGRATLGFVVRAEGGVRTPVASAVYPENAAKVVRHWLALLAACGAG